MLLLLSRGDRLLWLQLQRCSEVRSRWRLWSFASGPPMSVWIAAVTVAEHRVRRSCAESSTVAAHSESGGGRREEEGGGCGCRVSRIEWNREPDEVCARAAIGMSRRSAVINGPHRAR